MESTTVTALMSLTSSMVGAGIALLAQHWSLSRQFKHDNKKQLQTIEREKDKELKAIRLELLEICNEVLRVDGENQIIIDSRQGYGNFDIDLYFKTIRPLIYSKFHLIDSDTKKIVRQIDSLIAFANHEEELTIEDSNLLVCYYNEFIKKINVMANCYPDLLNQ